jgi:uncharacterized protein YcbK (DUF882 family)
MYISKHFTTAEFTCRCGCGQCIIDISLINLCEDFRIIVNKPMIVHSVNRCEKHNERVQGFSTSKHLEGLAMDFHVAGMSIKELHEIASKHHAPSDILFGGLGIYSWGVHVDVSNFRRWSGK